MMCRCPSWHRPQFHVIRNSRVMVLLVSIVMAACSDDPTITITNRSGKPLDHVVVSGSRFSESIGAMPPGAEREVTVDPRGESGVRLTFDVSNQHVDSGEQGYFEGSGGYHVSATVQPDLTVSVLSELRGY
jgi:hypothetical protein